jgi:alkylation response protein AidB-like acyl-CoA dehydrogenase
MRVALAREIDMPLSFPPGELSEEHQRLRAEVRSFLAAARDQGRFSPTTSSWMVVDPAFSRLCGEYGYIGMTWPKRYGGRERSSLDRYVVMEEMLAAGAPVGAHWIADRQSGPQILRYGSERLRERVLSGITRGEIYFVIGMSEPDAGSDLASIRSKAHRVEGGWSLNGRKIWTSNAHCSHYMIGLFRTEPKDDAKRHAGMTQFVVDLSTPGITCRPIENMLGRREFNEITFENVFVPDDHVLGTPGDGWSLVMRELAFERSGPERFLSVFPLLAAATDVIGAEATPGRVVGIGRLVARTAALREMSISIAVRLSEGAPVDTEAALVKDLGNALEQEMAGALRDLSGVLPQRGGGDFADMLAETLLAAPSYTLRGGTPEILRGIIAKGLGLR